MQVGVGMGEVVLSLAFFSFFGYFNAFTAYTGFLINAPKNVRVSVVGVFLWGRFAQRSNLPPLKKRKSMC